MKIESPSALKIGSASRASKSASKGKRTPFTSHVEEATQETISRSNLSVGELQDIQDVLQLQEVPQSLFKSMRSKERAEQILKELDKIRLSILSGILDKRSLRLIKNSLETVAIPSRDPQLNEIVLEIEQRLAIELAKIEMSEKYGKNSLDSSF